MPGLRSRIEAIRPSSVVSNTGWMVAGLGGNSLMQAATFVLLARLLGVAEYGIFAGAFALVSMVSPYSSLGSHMVFMRHVSANRSTATAYWGNSLAITSLASLVMMVALLFVGGRIFGAESFGLIATLVLANCFMGQITNNASIVFQTFERASATAWLRALSNLLRLAALATLMLDLHRATAFQCSLAMLASSTLAAIVALKWVRQVLGPMHLDKRLMLGRFWEGLGFSIAGSTTAVYNDVDKMMLSHYGMNVASGIYSMAYRIVDFATIPVNAIDAACLPRSFVLNNEGLGNVIRMAKKVVPIAAIVGLVSALFTLLASPLVVKIVGHGFSEALAAFRWLCWLPALRGVHQLAGGVLTAAGRQNHRTIAQFVVALLNFGLNLMWIPRHGWLGAAWASLISDGTLAALNLLLVGLVFLRASRTDHTSRGMEHAK